MGTAALARPHRHSKPSRRSVRPRRSTAALRGGILAGAVAAIAWLLAVGARLHIFFVLIIATVLALVYTVVARRQGADGHLGPDRVAWALVARRALGGQRQRRHHRRRRRVARRRPRRPARRDRQEVAGPPALPADLAGDLIAADTSVADPWGVSWLWVAAVLGPVVGARTLLNPSPRDHEPKAVEQPL